MSTTTAHQLAQYRDELAEAFGSESDVVDALLLSAADALHRQGIVFADGTTTVPPRPSTPPGVDSEYPSPEAFHTAAQAAAERRAAELASAGGQG